MLPTLGMLPLLKGKHKKHVPLGNVFFDKAEPGFNEAIRTVRTGISLDNLEHPHKVMVIASSSNGEGKSTVAMNLAHSFAQAENVLLLDGDMRRSSIGLSLNLPAALALTLVVPSPRRAHQPGQVRLGAYRCRQPRIRQPGPGRFHAKSRRPPGSYPLSC